MFKFHVYVYPKKTMTLGVMANFFQGQGGIGQSPLYGKRGIPAILSNENDKI